MGKFYYDSKGYPRWRDSGELVHRTVARNKVGGIIYDNYEVHHKDGNPRNFRKDNLVILKKRVHRAIHR